MAALSPRTTVVAKLRQSDWVVCVPTRDDCVPRALPRTQRPAQRANRPPPRQQPHALRGKGH